MLRLHLPKRTGININAGNERRVYHIGIEMTNEKKLDDNISQDIQWKENKR